MWSPWISLVIMSLRLLLPLLNCSAGTYIFISLDLIKILSCCATLLFNICIFPPAIKQAYGSSALHNGRKRTGHRGHTSWGVITPRLAAASHVLKRASQEKISSVLARWEWWKIDRFFIIIIILLALRQWNYYKWSTSLWRSSNDIQLCRSCWDCVSIWCIFFYFFWWRDRNLKKEKKKMIGI